MQKTNTLPTPQVPYHKLGVYLVGGAECGRRTPSLVGIQYDAAGRHVLKVLGQELDEHLGVGEVRVRDGAARAQLPRGLGDPLWEGQDRHWGPWRRAELRCDGA